MSCQAHALVQQNAKHEWFTLSQCDRCGCTANVKTFAGTSELWIGSESLDLCPVHMGVLFDVDDVTVETAKQATRREEAAAGAAQQQLS